MEKFYNRSGSSTIEAVIIVPIIMIFIMVVTMILILSYEKTAQVISEHRFSMTEVYNDLSILGATNTRLEEERVKVNVRVDQDKENNVDHKVMTVQDIQRVVELLFYLTSEYKDELEVVLDDKK